MISEARTGAGVYIGQEDVTCLKNTHTITTTTTTITINTTTTTTTTITTTTTTTTTTTGQIRGSKYSTSDSSPFCTSFLSPSTYCII